MCCHAALSFPTGRTMLLQTSWLLPELFEVQLPSALVRKSVAK
jgi:hypothetical protein